MEAQIKARLKKGWFPTKSQVNWLQDNLDPKYSNTCGHCLVNVHVMMGVDLWKPVVSKTAKKK